MYWWNDLVAIGLAVIFGAAIGLEREISGKAAGLRTNILISVGAAVFTIISRHMAADQDSLTRIAAGVVTGIGFLGAGAIIQDRGGVHGLTSAAHNLGCGERRNGMRRELLRLGSHYCFNFNYSADVLQTRRKNAREISKKK